MDLPKTCGTDRIRPLPLPADEALTDLVDAIVQAVDVDRDYEIDRLRDALEPFGAGSLFSAELRLNGTYTVNEWCICGGGE